MAALLTRLAPGRVRAPHVVALAGGLAAVIGAQLALGGGAGAPPCRGLERRLIGVWDPVRADALTAAFQRTGLVDAADTARRLRAGLDRYARSWTEARIDTCEAAQVRREQTPAQQELRTLCLDERLAELRAITDMVLAPDRELLTNAHAALASLTPPDACGDLVTLAERLPVTSSAQGAQVSSLRTALSRISALVAAGQFDAAEAELAALQPSVAATSYRPVQAEAALLSGQVADKQGRLAQAERELRDAALAAEAGRANRTAASAWLLLVHVRARGRGDVAGANDALAHAAAAVERLGRDVDAEAELAYARAVTLRLAGRYAEARVAFDDALRLYARSRLDRTVPRARSELELAGVLAALGELDAAQATGDRALATLREAVGSLHPDLAAALVVAAANALQRRDTTTAAAQLDEAERILRTTTGVEHPRYAQLLMVRGTQLVVANTPAEANHLLRQALELFQRRFGEQHAMVAPLHSAIAWNAINMDDPALARAELEIVTRLYDDVMGPNSLEAVAARMLRTWIALREDDPAGAEAAARASVDDARSNLGTSHVATAEATRILGHVLSTRDKLVESAAAYAEAIAIMRRANAGGTRATAQYLVELGEVLVELERFDEAAPHLAAAIAIERDHHAEAMANAQLGRYLLANVHRGKGDHAASVAVLEPLVAELSASSSSEPLLHRARLWLGIELAAAGGDPAHARALVDGARTALRTIDPAAALTGDRWLRTSRSR